jgi:hypothetical protein
MLMVASQQVPNDRESPEDTLALRYIGDPKLIFDVKSPRDVLDVEEWNHSTPAVVSTPQILKNLKLKTTSPQIFSFSINGLSFNHDIMFIAYTQLIRSSGQCESK